MHDHATDALELSMHVFLRFWYTIDRAGRTVELCVCFLRLYLYDTHIIKCTSSLHVLRRTALQFTHCSITMRFVNTTNTAGFIHVHTCFLAVLLRVAGENVYRWTDGMTNQVLYPRCACAPRVNKKTLRGGLTACNNLPQPIKTKMKGVGCGRLLHAVN